MHNKNFLKKKMIPANPCGSHCRYNGAPAQAVCLSPLKPQSRSKINISNSCSFAFNALSHYYDNKIRQILRHHLLGAIYELIQLFQNLLNRLIPRILDKIVLTSSLLFSLICLKHSSKLSRCTL